MAPRASFGRGRAEKAGWQVETSIFGRAVKLQFSPEVEIPLCANRGTYDKSVCQCTCRYAASHTHTFMEADSATQFFVISVNTEMNDRSCVHMYLHRRTNRHSDTEIDITGTDTHTYIYVRIHTRWRSARTLTHFLVHTLETVFYMRRPCWAVTRPPTILGDCSTTGFRPSLYLRCVTSHVAPIQ